MTTFAGSVLVLCVLAGVWAWRTTASVARQIEASVDELTTRMSQVASAADQVAGSAQSLSQGSTQQAASLEETSASMEEMASTTRRNAENRQEAATSMAETVASDKAASERRSRQRAGADAPKVQSIRAVQGGGATRRGARKRSAEEEIPLDGTGPFGSF